MGIVLTQVIHFNLTDLRSPGIGLVADQLILRNCKAEEWVMCKFLQLHSNGVLDLTYYGQMMPDKVNLKAEKTTSFELGNGITFSSNVLESHLTASQGGDTLAFKATVELTRSIDLFPGNVI